MVKDKSHKVHNFKNVLYPWMYFIFRHNKIQNAEIKLNKFEKK